MNRQTAKTVILQIRKIQIFMPFELVPLPQVTSISSSSCKFLPSSLALRAVAEHSCISSA